jgi:hypothetical protein
MSQLQRHFGVLILIKNYSSQNIIRLIEAKIMRWAGYVTRMSTIKTLLP